MLWRWFIQSYQLGHQTNEDCHGDSKSRLDRAMERIEPGMVPMTEKDDAAHIARHLGRISQMHEVAEKHGDQNAETNFPGIGR